MASPSLCDVHPDFVEECKTHVKEFLEDEVLCSTIPGL